jgi:hypothetical protein
MESETAPVTRSKNPKKVVAGRRGAEARRRKFEELKKQAAADQAAAQTEVMRNETHVIDDIPKHEPAHGPTHEPARMELFRHPQKWTAKTWAMVAACAAEGLGLYSFRNKKTGSAPQPTPQPVPQPVPQPTSSRTLPPVVDLFA